MTENKEQTFDVFLCHNSDDKPAVKEVALQLKAKGIRPWLDEWELQPGLPWQVILEEQIKSVKSAAVFVGPSGTGPWQDMELAAFIRQFVKRRSPVIPVLLPNAGETPELPAFLDGMTYIDFNRDESPLKRLVWGITGQNPNHIPNEEKATETPALPISETQIAPELFVGREQPLKELLDGLKTDGKTTVITGRLFNLQGAGGMGKTTLARHAAAQMAMAFSDGVIEITMDGLTPMAFAMELARRLKIGTNEPKSQEDAQGLISQLLKDRRILLILDNLIEPDLAPYMLPTGSNSCMIITTRNEECFSRLWQKRQDLAPMEITLDRFSEAEALDLFKRLLYKGYNQEHEGQYLEIAKILGYLPVALRLALNLMVFSPNYSAQQLIEKLATPERQVLLNQGAERDRDLRTVEAVFDLGETWLPSGSHRSVLEHLACCASGPVPLDFMEKFCEEEGLQGKLEDLRARSWCQARHTEEMRAYVMHDLVRDVVRSQYKQDPWDRFVDVVDKAYREEHFLVKDRWLPQLQEALTYCERHKDRRQIGWLYGHFHSFCEQRGHGALFIRLADQAARLFPKDEVLSVYSNQKALILMNWGCLEEAFELLNQSVEIFERQDDKQGLATCYGNQALILSDWGKLEEAHALHKKEEALCEALGDRDGLAACYGNQATILREWGKLEEAYALHKKQEELHEALGDRAGLAVCYGNQALIWQIWGKLEDALALHKKEEALFEALGDRAGLARSYWNQGSLLAKQGDAEGAKRLCLKARAMRQELGLPTAFYDKHLKALEEHWFLRIFKALFRKFGFFRT